MTVVAAEGAAPDTMFRGYLAKGELHLQVCTGCKRQIFYPRVLCPHCGGDLEWQKPAGTGTVYSTTIVRQRPDRGGDYNVAIIAFDEGARMLSRVEGVPPAAVGIGMKVRAAIIQQDGTPLVVFRPAEQGGGL